jgi:uncharacterized protein YggL (DUF469 family)
VKAFRINFKMKMEYKILAIILTHGRAKKVKTYETLKKSGFTGEIVLLIDNEDDQIKEYQKKFGDQVEIFNKKEYADLVDEMDSFDKRNVILHARNASFDIAKKRGYKYFIQLDDDYTSFLFKFNQNLEYKETPIKKIDKVFDSLIDFLNASKAKTICFAQNGDFLGGGQGSFGKEIKLRRKAMNSFICNTENRFWFRGRLNEDVNTYCRLGNLGELLFTIPLVSLIQTATQQNKGGMSDIYLEGGTYIKSFYTVMLCPSFVKIAMMGETKRRIHHKILWRKAVPKILDERHKKN